MHIIFEPEQVLISWTRAESEPITAAANGRQGYAEAMGFENYGRKDLTSEQLLAQHSVGAHGEWVTAEAFGPPLKFNPSIGKIDTVDLQILEVRARPWIPGRLDLGVRGKRDKLRLPHVLVHVDLPRCRACIPGWLCGWEAMERPDKVEFDRGEVRWWFVPPPYHTPRSLKQWIECGHPLHWAPDKYRA